MCTCNFLGFNDGTVAVPRHCYLLFYKEQSADLPDRDANKNAFTNKIVQLG